MSKFLQKSFILLFGLIAGSLIAEEQKMMEEQCLPKKENCCPCKIIDPCDKTTQCPPDICAYNAPVIFNKCAPTDLYVTGSFLYWKASADYLSYAFLDDAAPIDPANIQNFIFNGKTIEPKFKYKPAFKVGLGYKLDRDRWDLYIEYTRFHHSIHSFQGVNNQHIHALWLTFVNAIFLGETAGAYRSADSEWTTNLDILDAEIGRNLFLGRYLTVRPSLGLRTLWFDQKYNLTYVSLQNGIPVQSLNKSDSWGIGPRFSLNNAWNFCYGLKIIGDCGISLLHVQDHVSAKQLNPVLFSDSTLTNDISYANKEKLSTVKSILDLSLGLGWGHAFFRDKFFFDLLLSYDYSLFWNQASIKLGRAPIVAVGTDGGAIEVVVGEAGGDTGNFSLQGLTVTARFDF